MARFEPVIGLTVGAGGGVFEPVGIPTLLITTGAGEGAGFGDETGICVSADADGAAGFAATGASGTRGGASKTARGGPAVGVAGVVALAATPAGAATGLAAGLDGVTGAGLGLDAGAAVAAFKGADDFAGGKFVAVEETPAGFIALPAVDAPAAPGVGIDAGGLGKGCEGGTKPLPANGSRRAGADLRLCTGGAVFSEPSFIAASKSTALRDPEFAVNDPALVF